MSHIPQNHPPLARTLPRWREAVAGAGAGALSRTLLAPVERVKLIQQLQGSLNAEQQNLQQLSAIRVAWKIYREEGLLAFWRGNFPNVIRVAGAQALNFTCMDYYKRAAVAPFLERMLIVSSSAEQQLVERRRRVVTSFVSGGLAGATATTILYPIEFLRTRLAMDMGHDRRPSTSTLNTKIRQYTGMGDVLWSILKSDGVFGLYQGYGVALVGGIVYRVLYLGGYDACKAEWLYNKNRYLRHSDESAELSWGERFGLAQAISLFAGTADDASGCIRNGSFLQKLHSLYTNGVEDRGHSRVLFRYRTKSGALGGRGFCSSRLRWNSNIAIAL
jgi:solute carrier family 25 (mitochondrial adenine nucleotide translocator), member 4/5/6/31